MATTLTFTAEVLDHVHRSRPLNTRSKISQQYM